MCDYSLHAVASRPAKAGETLITTTFRGSGTGGFAAEAESEAVANSRYPDRLISLIRDTRLLSKA